MSDDPDWLPDDYDRDAPLADRLSAMVDIDSGIELWVGDDRGVTKPLGEPHELNENAAGTLTAYVGGSKFNWNFELVVPASDTEPFVRSVDPDQDVEDYQRTKDRILEHVDVRIYAVDHDRLEGVESEVPA